MFSTSPTMISSQNMMQEALSASPLRPRSCSGPGGSVARRLVGPEAHRSMTCLIGSSEAKQPPSGTFHVRARKSSARSWKAKLNLKEKTLGRSKKHRKHFKSISDNEGLDVLHALPRDLHRLGVELRHVVPRSDLRRTAHISKHTSHLY